MLKKRCRKNSQARNAMEKGFTTQLTNSVINNPVGFLPTSRTDAKSTFIIMGMIMSQIRMTIGTLIWVPSPKSRLLRVCTAPGAHFPKDHPYHHAEANPDGQIPLKKIESLCLRFYRLHCQYGFHGFQHLLGWGVVLSIGFLICEIASRNLDVSGPKKSAAPGA